MGGHGSWKYGGNLKPTNTGKAFMRKNSEPFSKPLSRNSSINAKDLHGDISAELDEMVGVLKFVIFVEPNDQFSFC